jgi:type IV pilus assembly protein PilO
MAAENPLPKLPLVGQLGISLGVAVLIGGLFYWLYWSDAVDKETKKTAELSALRDDIRKLEITASKLEEFKHEVQVREAKLEQLKQVLPAEKETPDLMRKVQYLAASSNLTIKRFTPGATVSKDFYQEWPINVDVEGTYHNLGLFFDRVGRLPRLMNTGGLKVRAQPRQTASNTIAASCVATTYVYVDKPAEPPKPGQK